MTRPRRATLYLVRRIDGKKPIGITCAYSLSELINSIDAVIEPSRCEYMAIPPTSAAIWAELVSENRIWEFHKSRFLEQQREDFLDGDVEITGWRPVGSRLAKP